MQKMNLEVNEKIYLCIIVMIIILLFYFINIFILLKNKKIYYDNLFKVEYISTLKNEKDDYLTKDNM